MSEVALQKDVVLEYLCDGAWGLGYKKEASGMVSRRLFLTADLQTFLKESSPESWKRVRKSYGSDEALTEAIEAQLYEDLMSSQNAATFLKQRMGSFTFGGEPFFLFFASGGSIGGKDRDFDKNIFTVVPEMAYSFEHEGKKVFSFRPDLAFFVNGVYFGYCELKSIIDGQTAEAEGRRKIARDYVAAVEAYARIAYTNDVTESLRRRMLHVFEKAIHITSTDLSHLYVVRNLATLTKGLKDQFVKEQIYPSDAALAAEELIKGYPKPSEAAEEYGPAEVFKALFSRFYARKEVEKEIRYYNFIKYNYKGRAGQLVRTSNTGTLISPRPKQKYGVDKVLGRLGEFLDHEGEPDYYTDKLRRQLKAQKLPKKRVEEILAERSKILNNKYVYSILLQYAAGFGKSNIIGWLASMMADMRRDGALVFDKILIVVDRIQLRDQLGEMMLNMNLSNVNFTEVTNQKELIRAMGDDKIRVAVVNIQKFNDFETVIAERGLSTREMRVAFVIDEIHRTNSGKLHDEMRSSFESLQDALEKPYTEGEERTGGKKNVIIGLTATPSDAVLARFGEFYKTENTRPIWIPFDAYTMKEAVEDGYILNPAEHIFKWVVSMEYTVPAGMSDEEEKYALRKKQIYNNDARIRELSAFIVERLYTTVYPSIRGYGKAMLATSSIEAATKYVIEIRKAIERRGPHPRFKDAKVYIVYSDRQGLPPASQYNDGMSEETVIKAFKQGKNGLMIVVDKLQTGFDEPLLHTLFLDKEITGINAIQTISRVNRTAKDKTECHIIDMSHNNVNKDNITDALALFSDLSFTILEPMEALDKLRKMRDELMGEELYVLYFKRFEALSGMEDPAERKTALNEILLKVQEWIEREIEEAKKRLAAAKKEAPETEEEGGFEDHAKQLKKKVREYLGLIFNFTGIVDIDAPLKEPHFLAFWEHYRRIYNTLTRNVTARSEIGVELDSAGFLPGKGIELTATVLPEDGTDPAAPEAPEKPKKPSSGSASKPDPVEEFVKKLNLEEEYHRELIDAGHRLEADFLAFVAADTDFQNVIHQEGNLFSDADKRRRFDRIIRRFRRDRINDYPFELENYLDHYRDRLYDYATGWRPIGYEEEPAPVKADFKDYDLPEAEMKPAAEDDKLQDYGRKEMSNEGKSPYKPVKQTIQELQEEQHQHFAVNIWGGKPFEHHNPDELKATELLTESPNYYEVIPSGRPSEKDNSLYLTIKQEWFDKIVSGEKTVEYRELKPTTINKYLDMRESSDGYVLVNPGMREDFELYPEGYNEGIFAYTPKYFEYLNLAVGYSKERDTATVRVKGIGFVPEHYHKGGPFRADFMDEGITDEKFREAAKKGMDAVQDLFYKADGPDTNWILAIHLGEVVEVHRK